MAEQRKGDLAPSTRFRSNRFCKEGDKWYFHTREGTLEGPFDFKLAAENRLEDYIKVMISELLPLGSQLSIEPLDPPHQN